METTIFNKITEEIENINYKLSELDNNLADTIQQLQDYLGKMIEDEYYYNEFINTTKTLEMFKSKKDKLKEERMKLLYYIN
jgi:septation ring formation regulator EzrA